MTQTLPVWVGVAKQLCSLSESQSSQQPFLQTKDLHPLETPPSSISGKTQQAILHPSLYISLPISQPRQNPTNVAESETRPLPLP